MIDAENFFIGPAFDITRMTILKPGELLTAIRLPGTWGGAQFYFEKVRDRQVWDFPLVNVASAMTASGGTIKDLRLAVNGVAAHPVRLQAVENAVRGKPRNEETAKLAGDLAIQGALGKQRHRRECRFKKTSLKSALRSQARFAGEFMRVDL